MLPTSSTKLPATQPSPVQMVHAQLEAVAQKKGLNRYLIVNKEGKLEQTHFLAAWRESIKSWWSGRPSLRDNQLIKLTTLQLVVSLGKEWTNIPKEIALVNSLVQRAGLTDGQAGKLKEAITAISNPILAKETLKAQDEAIELIHAAFSGALSEYQVQHGEQLARKFPEIVKMQEIMQRTLPELVRATSAAEQRGKIDPDGSRDTSHTSDGESDTSPGEDHPSGLKQQTPTVGPLPSSDAASVTKGDSAAIPIKETIVTVEAIAANEDAGTDNVGNDKRVREVEVLTPQKQRQWPSVKSIVLCATSLLSLLGASYFLGAGYAYDQAFRDNPFKDNPFNKDNPFRDNNPFINSPFGDSESLPPSMRPTAIPTVLPPSIGLSHAVQPITIPPEWRGMSLPQWRQMCAADSLSEIDLVNQEVGNGVLQADKPTQSEGGRIPEQGENRLFNEEDQQSTSLAQEKGDTVLREDNSAKSLDEATLDEATQNPETSVTGEHAANIATSSNGLSIKRSKSPIELRRGVPRSNATSQAFSIQKLLTGWAIGGGVILGAALCKLIGKKVKPQLTPIADRLLVPLTRIEQEDKKEALINEMRGRSPAWKKARMSEFVAFFSRQVVLDTEGILRLASKNSLELLERFNSTGLGGAIKNVGDVQAQAVNAADALKFFLQSCDLFSQQELQVILDARKVFDEADNDIAEMASNQSKKKPAKRKKDASDRISKLLENMSPDKRELFEQLVVICQHIERHNKANKMKLGALKVVLGPNLFTSNAQNDFFAVGKQNAATEFLIAQLTSRKGAEQNNQELKLGLAECWWPSFFAANAPDTYINQLADIDVRQGRVQQATHEILRWIDDKNHPIHRIKNSVDNKMYEVDYQQYRKFLKKSEKARNKQEWNEILTGMTLLKAQLNDNAIVITNLKKILQEQGYHLKKDSLLDFLDTELRVIHDIRLALEEQQKAYCQFRLKALPECRSFEKALFEIESWIGNAEMPVHYKIFLMEIYDSLEKSERKEFLGTLTTVLKGLQEDRKKVAGTRRLPPMGLAIRILNQETQGEIGLAWGTNVVWKNWWPILNELASFSASFAGVNINTQFVADEIKAVFGKSGVTDTATRAKDVRQADVNNLPFLIREQRNLVERGYVFKSGYNFYIKNTWKARENQMGFQWTGSFLVKQKDGSYRETHKTCAVSFDELKMESGEVMTSEHKQQLLLGVSKFCNCGAEDQEMIKTGDLNYTEITDVRKLLDADSYQKFISQAEGLAKAIDEGVLETVNVISEQNIDEEEKNVSLVRGDSRKGIEFTPEQSTPPLVGDQGIEHKEGDEKGPALEGLRPGAVPPPPRDRSLSLPRQAPPPDRGLSKESDDGKP